jgi:hypothetical protein
MADMGITPDMLERNGASDRVFDHETIKLFSAMKQVVREEWSTYEKLLKEMSDLAGQGGEAASEFARDQARSHDDRLLLRYFILQSRGSDG